MENMPKEIEIEIDMDRRLKSGYWSIPSSCPIANFLKEKFPDSDIIVYLELAIIDGCTYNFYPEFGLSDYFDISPEKSFKTKAILYDIE